MFAKVPGCWGCTNTAEILYTVELQWLEHLWDHENMFETRVVRANECKSLRQIRRHNMDIFRISVT